MDTTQTLYGIVEGFFSRPRKPWSTADRLSTVEFLGRETNNLRLYFYCPKEDPWVTDRWDMLYPPAVAQDLRAIFGRCTELRIEPVYGLNPGLTLQDLASTSSRSSWIKRVRDKCEQARGLGASGLALLFDDLPIAYDALDNSLFQSEPIASQMVELTNEIARSFSDIKYFWFCPPDYCFTKRSEITEACRLLDTAIGVLWSGNEIFAPQITSEDISRVEGLIGGGRPLIWWCNYPVNDCEQAAGEYNLGAFPGVPPTILARLSAILTNPMRECAANFPLYRTLDAFSETPTNYQRDEAWRVALSKDFETGADALAKITSMFSARNKVERGNGWLHELLTSTSDGQLSQSVSAWITLLREAETAQARNRYGEAFQQSIRDTFEDARQYLVVAQLLLNESQQRIALRGRFPTDLTTPRYAPEVADIASRRLATIAKVIGTTVEPNENLRKAFAVAQECRQKYVGSARCCISPSDCERYLAAMTQIALEEQLHMERVLNDRRVPVRLRLLALAERAMVNRFRL